MKNKLKNFVAKVNLVVSGTEQKDFALGVQAKDALDARGFFDGFFTAFGGGRVVMFNGKQIDDGNFHYDVQLLGSQMS